MASITIKFKSGYEQTIPLSAAADQAVVSAGISADDKDKPGVLYVFPASDYEPELPAIWLEKSLLAFDQKNLAGFTIE